MNIKELVLVISILLSIRIAEYAMKKYKEQKDVEVTKKQKSRKGAGWDGSREAGKRPNRGKRNTGRRSPC